MRKSQKVHYNWFRTEPEIEERMLFVAKHLTPCELIRQIYAKVEDPDIRMQLRVLTTMNKSMADRIRHYEGYWGRRLIAANPLYKSLNKEDE
jgi:hypothetical protein